MLLNLSNHCDTSCIKTHSHIHTHPHTHSHIYKYNICIQCYKEKPEDGFNKIFNNNPSFINLL